MIHRHMEGDDFSPTAIDDIIDRGSWEDWIGVGRELEADPELAEIIQRVCARHVSDPTAQRYHFWRRYIRSSE